MNASAWAVAWFLFIMGIGTAVLIWLDGRRGRK